MAGLKLSILVFLGAGLGAVGRYWLGTLMTAKFGGIFPLGTLTVNVSGSILIGIVMAQILGRNMSDDWRFFLVTGLLGGYTTFSAFSYETLSLLESRHTTQAFVYALLSLVLTIVGCWFGAIVGRFFLPPTH